MIKENTTAVENVVVAEEPVKPKTVREFCGTCGTFKKGDIRESEESSFTNGRETKYIARYAYCRTCGKEIPVERLKKDNLKSLRRALAKDSGLSF